MGKTVRWTDGEFVETIWVDEDNVVQVKREMRVARNIRVKARLLVRYYTALRTLRQEPVL